MQSADYIKLVEERTDEIEQTGRESLSEIQDRTLSEAEFRLLCLADALDPLFLERVTPDLIVLCRARFIRLSNIWNRLWRDVDMESLPAPCKEKLQSLYQELQDGFRKAGEITRTSYLPTVRVDSPGYDPLRFHDWQEGRDLSDDDFDVYVYLRKSFVRLYHLLRLTLAFQGDVQQEYVDSQSFLEKLDQEYTRLSEKYEAQRPELVLPDALLEAIDSEYANISRMHGEMERRGYYQTSA